MADWYSRLDPREFARWAADVAGGHVVPQGRRLDPFQTSMRDFKAVPAWMRAVDSAEPLPGDAGQHLADMQGAGLVVRVGDEAHLTDFGRDVLSEWERVAVADALESHEATRCVGYVSGGLRHGVASVQATAEFWAEITQIFDPLSVIESPVTLYALSYLAQSSEGTQPWESIRQGGPADCGDFLGWLDELAAEFGPGHPHAIGVTNLRRRIVDFSTRAGGRRRYCAAMEVVRSGDVAFDLLEALGLADEIHGCAAILNAEWSAPAPKRTSRRPGARPSARAVTTTDATPWTPTAIDPLDVAERRRLRLLRAERANKEHQRAVKTADRWLRGVGFATSEADYDMLAVRGGLALLIEVKSIGESADPRRQAIAALGQLAFYEALSVPPGTPGNLYRVVLFDRSPDHVPEVLHVLSQERVATAWTDGDTLKFADETFQAMVTGGG